jgi:RNA polymerase sigma factor (sigma-70 family)
VTAQALDGPQLSGPVDVIFAGVSANPLGQTLETRQLLVSDLLGVRSGQATHCSSERLLSVGGPVKTQFSADPDVGVALAAEPQYLVIDCSGRISHGVTSPNPWALPLTGRARSRPRQPEYPPPGTAEQCSRQVWARSTWLGSAAGTRMGAEGPRQQRPRPTSMAGVDEVMSALSATGWALSRRQQIRGRRVLSKRAAQPDEDLVRLYLNDVGKYALLTRAEEVRLAQTVEAGRQARTELTGNDQLAPSRRRELRRLVGLGEEATETFVKANLRLVVSVAKRYQAAELPLLDLVQEGNLGLIHAVEKFDWRKGFKFSTYATWWIRQAITRGIANSGRTVRLPVHVADLVGKVIESRGRLEAKLGRRPTIAELSSDLGLEEHRVGEILRYAAKPISLSEPVGSDGDAELGDMVEDRAGVSPFEVAAASLLCREVAKLLVVLDERERAILQLRFGLDRGQPRTLDEVGAHFNLTRERIRQIEARAMSKLRHPTVDGNARDLLTG